MGCDIHLYVERKENGRWVSADTWFDDEDQPGRKTVYKWGHGLKREAGPLYSSRNYDLFAILADVRNGCGFAGVDTGDGFNPISDPKGVPEDASPEYAAEVAAWDGDGHSHSYFTVAELVAYDWTQETAHRGWVTPREFGRFYLDGKPKSWSGMVSGSRVKHVSNDEMLALLKQGRDEFTWRDFHKLKEDEFAASQYTQVEWREPYYASCREFLGETMPKLWRMGAPDDVRICFFFDN